MAAYLNSQQATPDGLETVGPAIITWDGLSVGLDPNFADRLIDQVTVTIPAPINVITTTLIGTTANQGTVTTVTASSTLANS